MSCKKKSYDNIKSKLQLSAKHTICTMHSDMHYTEYKVWEVMVSTL